MRRLKESGVVKNAFYLPENEMTEEQYDFFVKHMDYIPGLPEEYDKKIVEAAEYLFNVKLSEE